MSSSASSDTPSGACETRKLTGAFFRGRQPTELRFGTSGLRGLVVDITDLEVYVNTRGFVDYIIHMNESCVTRPVSVAADLRPSSDGSDRSIVRAVLAALNDAGLDSEYLGRIPTPALTLHGLSRERLSIMVTGSHIPFDRNGIKFNKASGEVLKSDEAGILSAVQQVRERLYAQPASESPFSDDGMFRLSPPAADPRGHATAVQEYGRRYRDFFGEDALGGLRVAFYQHSAVGRDLVVDLLRMLGAEVVPMGRSESFVAIDTEALSADTLAALQTMADAVRGSHGPVDAVVSTDGDSDRPLVAGVTPEGRVQFIPGDQLGMLVAAQLGVDGVAVPVSANDGLDAWVAKAGVRLKKTRIGSPHVIAAMADLVGSGCRRVVGWEANGGFLTGSVLERAGRTLASLPTRDAVLPIVTALAAVRTLGRPLCVLQDELPKRYGRAGLLDQFPVEISRRMVRGLSPGAGDIEEADLEGSAIRVRKAEGDWLAAEPSLGSNLTEIGRRLAGFFAEGDGLGSVVRLNYLDGVRATFASGEVIHVRPSGNAPQLRCYTVADTPERATRLLELALQEPHGVLRRMEAAFSTGN
ncbi:MAG: phosphomannomutase [Verrucomicrobiales bacterium]|nr:phosphomannomutase [Verrucomicrobiales bacterium]